ncbi:MAG: V-type ATP synthase subunit I [Thermoplasmata archaeon]
MFKADKLSKIVIAGNKKRLKEVIEVLHSFYAVNIIEYKGDQKDFSIGSPLGEAEKSASLLVKVRALKKLLNVPDDLPRFIPIKESTVLENMEGQLTHIELEASRHYETKSKLSKEIGELSQKISILEHYKNLNIDLKYLKPYDNLEIISGTSKENINQILGELANKMMILNAEDNFYLLYYPKTISKEVKSKLESIQFEEIPLPEGEGKASDYIAKLSAENERLNVKKKEVESILDELKEKYSFFLLACEEALEISSSKALSPLVMGTSKNAFFLFAWVPTKKYEKLKNKLEKMYPSIYIDIISTERHEIIPTKFNHPRFLKPLEGITETYAVPSYHELDPTILFFTFFVIFFGAIVGDLGYGLVFIIIGSILIYKEVKGMVELGWLLIWSGIVASFFGSVVYADFFGIPFEGNSQYTWSTITHINIPLPSIVDKLSPSGIYFLLAFSLFLGILHLTLGSLIAIYNEREEGIKKIIGKVSWVVLLYSIFLIAIAKVSGAPIFRLFWNYIEPIFVPNWNMSGILIPYSSIILLIIGIIMVSIGEGPLSVVEIPKLISNLISYLRIGALCVAKAGLVYEFYVMLFPLVYSHNIVLAIVGIAITIFIQTFLLLLGSLSAGIQSIRLNYVEFGTKFFQGTGVKFKPFGHIRKFTIK